MFSIVKSKKLIPSVFDSGCISDPDNLWNSFDEGFENFSKMFENFFGKSLLVWNDDLHKHPVINIIEDNDKVLVEVAVTGFSKDQLAVNVVDENSINVTAKKNSETDKRKKEQYLVREIAMREFSKTIRFAKPSALDFNAVTSKCEDGLLTITLPKKKVEEKKANVKTVQIN